VGPRKGAEAGRRAAFKRVKNDSPRGEHFPRESECGLGGCLEHRKPQSGGIEHSALDQAKTYCLVLFDEAIGCPTLHHNVGEGARLPNRYARGTKPEVAASRGNPLRPLQCEELDVDVRLGRREPQLRSARTVHAHEFEPPVLRGDRVGGGREERGTAGHGCREQGILHREYRRGVGGGGGEGGGVLLGDHGPTGKRVDRESCPRRRLVESAGEEAERPSDGRRRGGVRVPRRVKGCGRELVQRTPRGDLESYGRPVDIDEADGAAHDAGAMHLRLLVRPQVQVSARALLEHPRGEGAQGASVTERRDEVIRGHTRPYFRALDDVHPSSMSDETRAVARSASTFTTE